MVDKFKKGAASFYIVAFSTLILVVLATSFAMVIASEVARTSNDDLSQSAYDSAMAGTEDAKLAFASYRRCAEAGAESKERWENNLTDCQKIMYWMQHPDCYMVGHILGKIPATINWEEGKNPSEGEVVVGAKIDGENVTNQAYTCVKISRDLPDYTGTINREKTVRTFRIMVGGEDQKTNGITSIKIAWWSNASANFFNLDSDKKVIFPQYNKPSEIKSPPMLEVKIVQTAADFYITDFDQSGNGRTDRATLYLVPVTDGSGTTKITKDEVVKTNDKTVSHEASKIKCDPSGNCSVDIELPAPIRSKDGKRNNNTFVISLSLPYQRPDTSFVVKAYCEDNNECGNAMVSKEEGGDKNQAKIYNTQISIDSTGRANDLYRRVETRLETEDAEFGPQYLYHALQILSGGINKNMKVEYECKPGESSCPSVFYF